MKVSLQVIASSLGVSKTTVSFVLNGKGNERNISKGTQERILKLAAALDYQPNLVAQNLKKGVTNTIGYLVPDISNPFFARLGRKIEGLLYANGYH
ncbi:MAG: LacI family transcriptional regulator [Bacteroidales bacterium]|nr:LacI family transcriptional regulator [Bacteroidales bacterium]